MAMHKKTKKLISYIATHLDDSITQVAKACGVSESTVANVRHRYKGDIAREANRMRPISPKGDQMELDLSNYPVLEEHLRTEEIQALCDRQSVDDLVDERADRYGKFRDLSEVSQRFKESLHYSLIARDKRLAPDQQEALEVILHKFARIINGDSDYVDNWKDIAGYATLVADRLEGNPR